MASLAFSANSAEPTFANASTRLLNVLSGGNSTFSPPIIVSRGALTLPKNVVGGLRSCGFVLGMNGL